MGLAVCNPIYQQPTERHPATVQAAIAAIVFGSAPGLPSAGSFLISLVIN